MVQSKRREGIGELLTRSLLDRAAALGASDGQVAAALQAAGARVTLRQYEMAKRLD